MDHVIVDGRLSAISRVLRWLGFLLIAAAIALWFMAYTGPHKSAGGLTGKIYCFLYVEDGCTGRGKPPPLLTLPGLKAPDNAINAAHVPAFAWSGIYLLLIGGLIGLSRGAVAEQPGTGMRSTIQLIDKVIEWTFFIFILVILPLMLANVVEVIWRYAFNDPTIWALDITTMGFGALILLAAPYALQLGAHVRTDMLWDKFSLRKKGVIDGIGYAVFFLPTMLILFFISIDDLFDAYRINERSNSGAWQPIIWPLRGVIPVTAALLFLQGVSELLKSFWSARSGRELVHHEKIEV